MVKNLIKIWVPHQTHNYIKYLIKMVFYWSRIHTSVVSYPGWDPWQQGDYSLRYFLDTRRHNASIISIFHHNHLEPLSKKYIMPILLLTTFFVRMDSTLKSYQLENTTIKFFTTSQIKTRDTKQTNHQITLQL